jgi:hypothetical protein
MGVYVYQHTEQPFIKMGHYAKENPWSRVAHRGFRCCNHPAELEGKLMLPYLRLLAWFPALNTSIEKQGHRHFKSVRAVGEWYGVEQLPAILQWLRQRGSEVNVTEQQLQAAMSTRRRL